MEALPYMPGHFQKAISTHETKHIFFFLQLFKPFKNWGESFASDALSRAVEVHRVQFRFTAVHRCTTEEMNKHRHNDDTGPHEATYIKMTVIPMIVGGQHGEWLTVPGPLTKDC